MSIKIQQLQGTGYTYYPINYAETAGHSTSADTATNSDTLDGYHANQFLKNDEIIPVNLLDGYIYPLIRDNFTYVSRNSNSWSISERSVNRQYLDYKNLWICSKANYCGISGTSDLGVNLVPELQLTNTPQQLDLSSKKFLVNFFNPKELKIGSYNAVTKDDIAFLYSINASSYYVSIYIDRSYLALSNPSSKSQGDITINYYQESGIKISSSSFLSFQLSSTTTTPSPVGTYINVYDRYGEPKSILYSIYNS